MEKKIDHLDEDPVIPSQQWLCISYLSPEGLKNCKVRGVKVRGVYATYEEATARAKQLQEFDPNFDIFVGEVGKWMAWNPDPATSGNQEYANEKLNDLMKSYKTQLEKSKVMEQQRKAELIDKSIRHEDRAESIKERLRKKLEEKRSKESRVEEVKVEEVKETKEDLTEKIKEKENEVKEIKKEKMENEMEEHGLEEKLKKMEELYKSMKK